MTGSYRVTARELSGDCGPIPERVDSAGDADGCWQMDGAAPADVECGLTYARRCTSSDGSSALLGVSVAREGDDETWSGAIDATLRDAAGRVVCHSLYSVTFTQL